MQWHGSICSSCRTAQLSQSLVADQEAALSKCGIQADTVVRRTCNCHNVSNLRSAWPCLPLSSRTCCWHLSAAAWASAAAAAADAASCAACLSCSASSAYIPSRCQHEAKALRTDSMQREVGNLLLKHQGCSRSAAVTTMLTNSCSAVPKQPQPKHAQLLTMTPSPQLLTRPNKPRVGPWCGVAAAPLPHVLGNTAACAELPAAAAGTGPAKAAGPTPADLWISCSCCC